MESRYILETKLRPTFASSRLLSRERLLRILNRAESPRLILVNGAAGAGKSSLLYHYVSQRSQPVAWYSLTPEDGDPSLFFTYVTRALSDTYSELKDPLGEALERMSAEGWEPLATTMANEILRYGRPVSLVLDDYQLVQDSEPIHQWTDFMVRKGPSNLTMVLATRELPELPLAFLRSKGMLVEIRPEDLRFEESEVQRLFREVWALPLDESLVRVLLQKTEGWVTGLQLVWQAVQGRSPEECRAYVEGLEGRDSFVYQYLASEVFEQQPPPVQNFLKSTSVPEHFNAELAGELSGANPLEMLDYVEKARLFLVHLDERRDWFRYHHLFRDFLRRRLAVDDGQQRFRQLHERAGSWLAERSDLVAAVPHYLQAESFDKAAQAIESVGSHLLSRGMQSTVERWLEGLPASLRRERSGLRLLQAELLDLRGQWGAAVETYRAIALRYRDGGQLEEMASVMEKLALCYAKYGETDKLLETCEEGLETCPPEADALRAILWVWKGNALIYSGRDWDEGFQLIQKGHALAYRSGDPRAISWGCLTYGYVFHFVQGNFQQALATLNEGIEFFKQQGWSMVVYQLAMNKAVVMILKGDLDSAADLIEDTLHLAESAGHTYVARGMQNLRAFLSLERRDFQRARDEIAREAERSIPAQMKAWHHRNRMLIHLFEGNPEQALVSRDEMRRFLTLSGFGMYALECLISESYLLLHLGDFGATKKRLGEALELCRRARAKFWEMKAHVVHAVLARQEGDVVALQESLAEMLRLTRANDYTSFWLSDPFRLAVGLLVDAVTYDIESTLAEELLAEKQDISEDLLALVADERSETRAVAVRLLGRAYPELAEEALRRIRSEDPNFSVRETAHRVLQESSGTRLSRVQIAVLGPFRVTTDGECMLDKKVMRPQAVRLLKYLLAHYDRFVPVDRILDEFWPDSPPEKARHNLSVHLSLIRKAVTIEGSEGGILINRVPDGYRLEFGKDCEFDLRDFERLTREGWAFQARGDREGATARFLRAEQLYAGDFLNEDLYDDWVISRRKAVRDQYDQAVEFLGDTLAEKGEYEAAALRYRAILTTERLDERLPRKLLQCYAQLGDRATALRAYEEFREELEATDLEPSLVTRELVDRLLSRS